MFLRLAFLGLLSTTALAQPAFAVDKGTLQIFVSKDAQTITVYEDGRAIATSKVSTGKVGHTTPSGIFSILEKRRYHESNIYSDAPMPFMQRLTWSGIALHESGHVPKYPASHGCIRMPHDFAKALYKLTERGVPVVVTDEKVAPRTFSHPALFTPVVPVEDNQVLSDAELRPSMPDVSGKRVEVAMNAVLPKVGASATAILRNQPPLRILITRRSREDTISDVQTMLGALGYDAGIVDGHVGPVTRAAINDFKESRAMDTKGAVVTREFLSALYKTAGRGEPPQGKIMVRQKFKPLFEAPVVIHDPELGLGTHLLTAIDIDHGSGETNWNLATLENNPDRKTSKGFGIIELSGTPEPDAASRALDRIEIPPDVRHKIGLLLSTGSTVTITDYGVGTETGDGTDFITVIDKYASSLGSVD
ncbi:L,D-transpeptidase family protein [Rhizobiaceae bacterium n13]|uniref:L,D-transpeptidase family protein n=1 Tax=Ferirhizobium litorale TaxID=2927786 RepID=A0AAE3QK73_9HYPH|nr:L,D-transpeptidase family protein [Fererhizobium litorale]MDI7864377.1 L,D-transpeptidase family protein [Fererhizobium litorale]MDI7924709.1 L,D-transpeptidase family protein [Fererhizobium litorale]